MGKCEKPDIGKRIKKQREKKGLTQDELAKKINMDRTKLTKIETGDRDLKPSEIVDLAKALDTTCDYLISGTDTKNIKNHRTLGLSNEAINILEELKIKSQKDPSEETFKSGIVIEFLNLIIESIETAKPNEYFYFLASRSVDYIVGTHVAFLFQKQIEKKHQKAKSDFNIFNIRNDDLEFEAYRLVKFFEDLMNFLIQKPDIVERIKDFYRNNYCYLPKYEENKFLKNHLEWRIKDKETYDWGKKLNENWGEDKEPQPEPNQLKPETPVVDGDSRE